MERLRIVVDSKEYSVQVEKSNGKLRVYFDGSVYDVEIKPTQQEYEIKEKKLKSKGGVVLAPIPGTIYSIDVKEGSIVKKGERLMTLIAMKMENEVVSPADGKVIEIRVKKGQSVNKGDVLAIVR